MATRLESWYGRDYAGYITAGRCGVLVGVLFLSDDVNTNVRDTCERTNERANGRASERTRGKKIEINASGLMKGRQDHQLLEETELLLLDEKAECVLKSLRLRSLFWQRNWRSLVPINKRRKK